MDRIDIQKLRELPLEGVAERLGLRVQKHKSLCPFHEDRHPSLSFSTSKNTFKCFVCDAHGGVIDLAMHVLGKSFIETCEWLANEHNIILTKWKPAEKIVQDKPFDAARYNQYFERPFINLVAKQFLYEERHLDPRVIRWCRITSWTNRQGISWLQIPYYSMDGVLTGVQWRRLTKAEGLPRFRFPMGSQCHVYNLPVLKMLKADEPLFITEGCSDCWAMLSAGHKAIAVSSATLLKPSDFEPIKQLVRDGWRGALHIYPDRDEPGENLYRQLVSLSTQIGVCIIRHELPSGCKDFAEYYANRNSSTQI